MVHRSVAMVIQRDSGWRHGTVLHYHSQYIHRQQFTVQMRSTSIKLCPETMSRLAFVLYHQSHNIRNQSFPLLMGSLAMVLHKDNSRLWRNVIPHQVLVGLHGGVIQGLCGDMQFRCLVSHETSDSMRLRCRRARLRWSLVPKPCGNPCYFLCKASELINYQCWSAQG